MIIPRASIVSALALSLSLCTGLAAAQSVEHTDVAPMIGAINAERARFSLPPLAEDPRLDAIAESHSMEMARAHFFSHESPTTGAPSQRVANAGLRWSTVAENIAINQSPEAAQQALLRSPGHHENMVDPAQRSVGIGIVRHGEQVWVTQLFASLNDSPAPAVNAPATPAAATVAAPTTTPSRDEADDEGDDEEDASDDGDEVAQAPCPAPALTAPAPATAPSAAPAAPLPLPLALPVQGIPGLDQFLTGLGMTRQPAAAARRGQPAAPQVYTVQTPFGPVRVEVPSSPGSAAPTATAAPAPAARAHSSRAARPRRAAPARGRVVQLDTLDI